MRTQPLYYKSICIPKQTRTAIQNLGDSYSSVELWEHLVEIAGVEPATQRSSVSRSTTAELYLHLVGRVRFELTTRSFAWNFEVSFTMAVLSEENLQKQIFVLPALPAELSPHKLNVANGFQLRTFLQAWYE